MAETNTQNETSTDTRALLASAAANRNFPLTRERTSKLLEEHHEATRYAKFYVKGVAIGHPILFQTPGGSPRQLSNVDFVPQVQKDDNILADPNPQRGRTTQITLIGMSAFQDFVLLADAGLLNKPEGFFGTTNHTMAKFAERIGFETVAHDGRGEIVVAPYDTVADRIFSPDMLALQERLAVRADNLSRSAGTLAVVS